MLQNEEAQFNKTIDQGLKILADMEKALQEKGEKTLPGTDVFKLYDTYGFPVDLTREILEEKGYTLDEEGFVAEMQAQRTRARDARQKTNYMGADATVYDELDASLTTNFVGYDHLTADATITALTTESEVVRALTEGQRGTIFTDATTFYATMGGQEGDTGVITGQNGSFKVEETIKLRGGKVGHVGVMTAGMIAMGETVTLSVDLASRNATCKNHSATHLLQKALKTVLGAHVEQKGSLVTPDRLRFDFAHFQAMTAEQLAEVEALVNAQIAADLPVVTAEMTLEEAKSTGAMALFGEKYGETVRVVTMGDFSKELCGGTHVSHTGTITLFKLLSESGIAAGVRRIEALTGEGVLNYYKELEARLNSIAAQLKVKTPEIENKLTHLAADMKALQSENESLKSKLAQQSLGDILDKAVEIKGVQVLAAQVEGLDAAGLREFGDNLKDKCSGVIVLASQKDGKASLLTLVAAEAQKQGAHAGLIVMAVALLCGGNGGGKPDAAMAGAKDTAKLNEALDAVPGIVEAALK